MKRREFLKISIFGFIGTLLIPFVNLFKTNRVHVGSGNYITDKDKWFLKPYDNMKTSDLTYESLQQCFKEIEKMGSDKGKRITFQPKQFYWYYKA